MPHISGLPENASFEMKKALTAAAANYGCPMLWADGHTNPPPVTENYEGELIFTENDLKIRYQELAPNGIIDLVVIGCPQASVGEVRTTASLFVQRWKMGYQFLINVFGYSLVGIITKYYNQMVPWTYWRKQVPWF